MSAQDYYKVASNPVIERSEYLDVLFSGESQTKPLHKLGPKFYDFYLMHHVLDGKGVFECGGQSYGLEAGHTFLIEPERLVSYSSDEENPWRYRWVAFSGSQAPLLAAAAGFTSSDPVIAGSGSKRIPALFHRIYNEFRHGDPSSEWSARGYLQLLAAEYGKARYRQNGGPLPNGRGGSDLLLQQMIHYLSTQYVQPVSIEQMAESLGYNRAYLSRIFKRHTGVSPVTFLLKLRIDKARQLLREREELTIEQIAASVGLQDSLYFSKQFRRFYGMSPSAYREQMHRL
ncbi:helix-turn-helix domain-containing protein [Paenibacillus sp. NPDC058071]|uniref:AraC family transcriptional regulator n=1 Tax=Paenibacillus sp. NPDC058071 TaxID=3346326 RepID=UPI0036DE391C